jgi:hypothetical protein
MSAPEVAYLNSQRYAVRSPPSEEFRAYLGQEEVSLIGIYAPSNGSVALGPVRATRRSHGSWASRVRLIFVGSPRVLVAHDPGAEPGADRSDAGDGRSDGTLAGAVDLCRPSGRQSSKY